MSRRDEEPDTASGQELVPADEDVLGVAARAAEVLDDQGAVAGRLARTAGHGGAQVDALSAKPLEPDPGERAGDGLIRYSAVRVNPVP